jgi:hypothetical protein
MAGRQPDFAIIGAMKCATTTLHEQLARQPGVFMSRPKEPNFFSDDDQYARGLDWYWSLFRDAGTGVLCGESSTHYTKLPTYPHTVERLRKALPDVKLVYVMRHPIDRLISQYVHEKIEGTVTAPIDEAVDRRPELVAYSLYSMQVEPFLAAYGPERVLPVFFERLIARPQDELERIWRFLGAAGRPAWDHALAPLNSGGSHLRRSPLRTALVNSPALTPIRRRLIPKPWAERLKALWRVRPHRPAPAPATVERLRDRFDDDLARLGTWLGINLCCDRFQDAALAGPHHWAELDRRESDASTSPLSVKVLPG